MGVVLNVNRYAKKSIVVVSIVVNGDMLMTQMTVAHNADAPVTQYQLFYPEACYKNEFLFLNLNLLLFYINHLHIYKQVKNRSITQTYVSVAF